MHPQSDLLHVAQSVILCAFLLSCCSSMCEDNTIPGASILSVAHSADAALQDCALKAAPLQLWHKLNMKHFLQNSLSRSLLWRSTHFKKLTTLSVYKPKRCLLSQACSLPCQQGCCFSSQAVASNDHESKPLCHTVAKCERMTKQWAPLWSRHFTKLCKVVYPWESVSEIQAIKKSSEQDFWLYLHSLCYRSSTCISSAKALRVCSCSPFISSSVKLLSMLR